jgi:quinohemoprotein ethanol dehydrogenase
MGLLEVVVARVAPLVALVAVSAAVFAKGAQGQAAIPPGAQHTMGYRETAVPGRVDAARLRDIEREPGQWLTLGRDFSGAYYSPLTAINRDNVKHLGFAWELNLGTRRGLEATPLVVDGVMYASGNWGVVYALDAATGRLRWTYNPNSNPQVARYEQNDVVSRGLAVWKGRVYVVSSDCRLIALDAGAGSLVWQADSLIDHKAPYVCSGAPQIAGDLLVVGNVGADTSAGGLRGYVSAYDSQTGALRWRFFTVPSLRDASPSPEMIAAEKTWDPKRDPSLGGGGNVWNGMAYDPTLGLVYIGTGNAAPYGAPRDAQGHRTDNLYTASIVALHAETGRLAWYFQTTPGDRWDFDATATMVLADLTIEGHKRATLLQANKNGYFYVLDRSTGKPISAKAYSYVNWSSGLDNHFRPIVSPDAEYHSSPKLIYPSVQGAHSWPPMAFSPRTGLAYIPSIDAPSFLIDLTNNPGAGIRFVDEATDGVAYVVPDRDFDPQAWRPIVGALPKVPGANPKTGKARIRSSIKAWDPVAQQVVWEQQTSDGYLLVDGGTLATAGDLVFAGREDGAFLAYDARTGSVLKVLDTGTPIMAAPMTFEVGGIQYVAVMAAHGGGYLGSFAGTAALKYVNEGRIIAFKLGGASEVPKPPIRTEDPYRRPPPMAAMPNQVASGLKLFNVWCARCHSLGVPGVTPDLSHLRDGIDNLAVFQAIVLNGAFVSRGMARFDDVLSPVEVESLHAYLLDEARQGYERQSAAAVSGKSAKGGH